MWYLLIVVAVAYSLLVAPISIAGTYVAFSLGQAEKMVKNGTLNTGNLSGLSGIKRFAAIVYDKQANDLILVGRRGNLGRGVTLDDLVVALRTALVKKELPLVSIDKSPDSKKTNLQKVRFEGGIENTRYGLDFLEADVVLKRIALGLEPTDVWGIRSYFDLFAEQSQKTGASKRITSLFWFDVRGDIPFSVHEGVGAFSDRLLVNVSPRLINIEGEHVDTEARERDTLAEEFAQALSQQIEDVGLYYPPVARLRLLFELYAVARCVELLPEKPDLSYWLYDYNVKPVATPKTYPLLERAERIRSSSERIDIILNGGIRIKPRLKKLLKVGDVTALRDIVIATRPGIDTMSWEVPLEGWNIPGGELDAVESNSSTLAEQANMEQIKGQYGFQLTAQATRIGGSISDYGSRGRFTRSVSYRPNVPDIQLSRYVHQPTFSSRVGGVMLSGAAAVVGNDNSKVDLANGNFSFVIDGKNARLDPKTFRKFVTALWSVYFSRTDPGISIDPICSPSSAPECKGIDKHLVRYIGKVVNTDLGRVMREADYVMKQWAVGTEKPDIPGFRDVDALMARHGAGHAGASRRFWFVPEKLQFKRAGDTLLFDSGSMRVKTELEVENKPKGGDPADNAFANFFTEKYQTIARQYPIYEELFEYAKMVALAKYLKSQGVPLYWFLMANKDLVITEDSPGTVDELAKGSEHFRGVEIRGGVELGEKGRYVFDKAVADALRKISAKKSSERDTKTGVKKQKITVRQGSDRYSFDVGKESYTVSPQHTLTSGKDRRGIRYQTDLALRQDGEPSMELVRYFDPNRRETGELGRGWRLLIPYRVRPAGRAKRHFAGAIIPERMMVENQITGHQEVLTFSTDHYSIAGYAPAFIKGSQVVGLFLLSDGSFRLVDKLGSEFHFDSAGYMTKMMLSKDHRVGYRYVNRIQDEFEETPYYIRPKGRERVDFRNINIPKRIQVVDLIGGHREVLTFGQRNSAIGYVPEEVKESRYKILQLLSDASYKLIDQFDNEVVFDASGKFNYMQLEKGQRMVESMNQGKQKIKFQYTLTPNGTPRISGAHLVGSRDFVVWYWYGAEGRLARVTRGPERG